MPEGKKVLIVEDEDMISSMYKTKLEQEGYIVSLAANGSDGLKMVEEVMPDILLLDVIMPMLDGFSVLAEIKQNKKTKDIPTVMLTNLSTDEDRKKAADMGAIDYWVKADLTPAEVSAKIGAVFNK